MHKLHNKAVQMVCAKAQSEAVDRLCDVFTQEEKDIIRRGRNVSSVNVPKSSTVADYRKATGLECLFGTLYLRGQIERIKELFSYILEDIGEDNREF